MTRGVLNQNNGISEENITKILAFYQEVNPTWLITGKGEMIISNVITENNLQMITEPQAKYLSNENIEIELREQIKLQQKIIQDKEEMIDFLKSEINRLKGIEPITKTA